MPVSSALDLPTLIIVSTAISALMGFFLLFAWLQERGTNALAWWGAAYLIGGFAMALWSRPLPPPLLSELPVTLLLIACGMVWNGVRVFFKRRVLPLALCAGPLVWIAAVQSVGATIGGRLVLGAIIVAAYAFFTTVELRRDRRRSNLSHARVIVIPAIHGTIFLLPMVLHGISLSLDARDDWLPLFALETMIYAVGLAFIVLFMVKDHTVQIHKTAASTDPLTGLFNRRAFFEAGHELIEKSIRARHPVSVLMFDLDRFKSINDRYGHATGDDVIKRFAQTIAVSLRTTDIVGRLGGEEFAAIVPGNRDIAKLIGERVRGNFEIAGQKFKEVRIGATCSVGAASMKANGTAGAVAVLEHLLERADNALYRAKEGGRNQVRLADSVHPVAKHIAAARAELPRLRAPDLVPQREAAVLVDAAKA